MHDKWVIGGTTFGGVDARNSVRIISASGKAVDGFGWHCNQAAITKPNGGYARIRGQLHRLIQPHCGGVS